VPRLRRIEGVGVEFLADRDDRRPGRLGVVEGERSELPVGGRRRSGDDVLAALERVTISFERMRRELDDPSGQDGRPQGPRAA
jgi:hypothetical protein